MTDHRRDGPDEFADSRLPDLPTAGYATKREKQLTDAIMFFIRDAERDRLYLLSMVCDGVEKFVGTFTKAYRYLRADKELAEAVFGYLVLLAGNDPSGQRDALLKMNPILTSVWPTKPRLN